MMTVLGPHLKTLARTVQALLYPPSCFYCKTPTPWETSQVICEHCAVKINLHQGEPLPPRGSSFLDRCYSVFPYRGVSQRMILRWKIQEASFLEPVMEQYLKRYLKSYMEPLAQMDALVPLPSHRSWYHPKKGTRSEALANTIKNILGVPVKRLLRRSKTIAKQTTLSRKKRLENPRGSLQVKNMIRCLPSKALLIDDVITTGATADEAARILKTAGVKSVSLLTLARG